MKNEKNLQSDIYVDDKSCIIIDFSKYVGEADYKKDKERFDIFRLNCNGRRVYITSYCMPSEDKNPDESLRKELVTFDVNRFLNYLQPDDVAKYIARLYSVKKAVDYGAFMPGPNDDIEGKIKNFISYISTTIFTNEFVRKIKDYVSKNYVPDDATLKTLDTSVNRRRFNESTTFTPQHIEMLYTVSYMIKLITPLCTHYVYVCNNKNINVLNFLSNINKYLLLSIQHLNPDNKINLYNKLHTAVKNVVIGTKQTDSVMWQKLSLLGKTPESTFNEIYEKVVANIILKFKFGSNIINFMNTVCRKSVEEYVLKAKFPINPNLISESSLGSGDDDKLAESDILEGKFGKKDETFLLFKKYANDKTVAQLCNMINIDRYSDEMNWYYKHLTRNKFQVLAVTQCSYFTEKFRSEEHIESCNKHEIDALTIIMRRYLDNLGFKILNHIITGERTAYLHNKKPNKAVLNMILNHPTYENILQTKYKDTLNIFENTKNGNPIKDCYINILTNEYVYCEYNNPLNGKKIEYGSEEDLANEILNFFKMFI